MAKLRKPKPLTAGKLVRERARAAIGTVPATRRIADGRQRPPKHKHPPQPED